MNNFVRNFPWRWLLLGALAYLVFLVATLPAAKMVSRLQSYNVQASGVSGSIWRGHAAALRIRNFNLGDSGWRVNFLPLLLGKVSIDLHSQLQSPSDASSIAGNISFGFGNRITLRNVQATLPLAALRGLNLPGGWPSGWQAQVQLRIETAQLLNRWPTSLQGRVAVSGLLREVPPPAAQLGDHNIIFEPVPSNKSDANNPSDLIGKISSAPDAPLDISGNVRLTAKHSCVLDALIKLRANAPLAIRKQLEQSILPKEQGGWRVTLEYAAAGF